MTCLEFQFLLNCYIFNRNTVNTLKMQTQWKIIGVTINIKESAKSRVTLTHWLIKIKHSFLSKIAYIDTNYSN
jgi:hypothetical protein